MDDDLNHAPSLTDSGGGLRMGIDNITLSYSFEQTPSFIDMPAVFTPNNDGNNDVFRAIKLACVNSFQFDVFNRWGNLIHSSNTELAWNGSQSNSGTYYWTILYIDCNGKENISSGVVQLIK